jgi:hypothetical protein
MLRNVILNLKYDLDTFEVIGQLAKNVDKNRPRVHS